MRRTIDRLETVTKPETSQATRAWLISPIGSTLLVSLVLILANLVLAFHLQAYTSDDVIWQNALLHWRPFSHNTYYSDGGVSYILKVPLYWIVGLVFTPSRLALLFEGCILSVGNFLLFYWSVIYFLKKLSITPTRRLLLPVLYLASFGYSLSQLFLQMNMHNIEVGLIFAFFMVCAHYYFDDVKIRPLWYAALTIILSFIAGATIIDDRYFIYFGIVPVLIATAVSFLWYADHAKRKRLVQLVGLVGLSFVFAYLVQKILTVAGNGTVAGAQTPQFAPYSVVYGNLAATLHDIFIMFSANFWSDKLSGLYTVSSLVNASIVIIMFGFIIRALHGLKRQSAGRIKLKPITRFAIIFFAGLFVLMALVFTISTVGGPNAPYHYVVILPFIANVLLLFQLHTTTKTFSQILCGILVVGIVLNLYTSIDARSHPTVLGGVYADSQNVGNSDNFRIINHLEQLGLSKGYANYWDANIDSYLSKGRLDQLPITCNSTGRWTEEFKWLVAQNQFNVPAQRSYYLVNPANVWPPICSVSALYAQFGKPARVDHYSGVTILIYNYDIGSRLYHG